MVTKTNLDKNIKQLRKQLHGAEDYKVAMFIFKELNKLQRLRHKKYGTYLPHQNGFTYVYNPSDDIWLRWRLS